MLAVLSYFAEYEAKKISRRTKAGLERAREEGQVGRPSKFEQHRDDLEAMRADSCSKAEMTRRTGLAYNTVSKYLEKIESTDRPMKGS